MNKHDATEIAYKNGYQDAVRDMQERLVERFKTDTYSKYSGAGVVMVIDQIVKEMLEETK